MEIDVVDQKHLPVVQRREESGHLLCERRQVVGCRALGCQAGRPDLEDSPDLVHVVDGELVERRQKAERLGTKRGRTFGDVCARPAPRSDDAERGQRAQPGANRRTAHADLPGQVALRRQTGSGSECAAVDQFPHVGHHLRRAVGGGGTVNEVRIHDWSSQLLDVVGTLARNFADFGRRLPQWLCQL